MPVDPQIQALLDLGTGVPATNTLSVAAARAQYEGRIRLMAPAPDVGAVTERSVPGPGGDLRLRIYRPAGPGPFPLLAFFHGSGFVLCSLDTHDGMCRNLCAGAGCVVVSVDYRLAPEHKFPAGLDDCVFATRWIAEHAAELDGDADRLAVCGDSAGGNLAAAAALRLRDEGGPPLVGQLLIYPVTDYHTPGTPSYRDNAEGYGLTRDTMVWFWDHYLADPSAGCRSLRIAVARARTSAACRRRSWSPPNTTRCATKAKYFAEKLRAAGTPATTSRWDGMNHGFFFWVGRVDKADEAMAESCRWLRRLFREAREQRMQFGLFGAAQAQRGGPDVDSAAGFKDYIEYVIEAEALGYQSAFIVEHHFTGFGQVSATLNLLTWIGARTRTLRLGTAVIVLPWHNPVLLAEQAATVDLLSGGRLDFGIGKGYRHNEFVGFRIPMEEAEPRFEESIDIITKAWTSNERFSFHGRYWQFDDIVVEPPTIQKPHPPFWQGAGHPESIRRVARRGHNLLLDQFASLDETGKRFATYRDAMQANGFAFHPSQVGVARAFYVARDSAEKEAALDRRIAGQRRLHAISQRPDGNNTASIMAFSDTRAASEESALYGNPDEIARKIEQAARHGRGIRPAERRRHLARQPAALRQGGDAGVPHRAGDARGGLSLSQWG